MSDAPAAKNSFSTSRSGARADSSAPTSKGPGSAEPDGRQRFTAGGNAAHDRRRLRGMCAARILRGGASRHRCKSREREETASVHVCSSDQRGVGRDHGLAALAHDLFQRQCLRQQLRGVEMHAGQLGLEELAIRGPLRQSCWRPRARRAPSASRRWYSRTTSGKVPKPPWHGRAPWRASAAARWWRHPACPPPPAPHRAPRHRGMFTLQGAQ